MQTFFMLFLLVQVPAGADTPAAEAGQATEFLCKFAGECPLAGESRASQTRMSRGKRGFKLERPSPIAGTRADLRLNFERDTSNLTPDSVVRAEAFARALNSPNLAKTRFRLEGHTDSTGNASENLLLSRARASAVVDLLVKNGVAKSRLDAVGLGSNQPLPGKPSTAEENRRVEAVLLM